VDEPNLMANCDYRQISCSHHDRVEAAVVTGKICELNHRTADGGERMSRVRLTDVLTRNGEEFVLTAAGDEIRLDKVISLDGFDFGQ